MDTRILPSSPNVSFATTSARVTPSPPSASKFGDVLASTAVQSAESAMTVLPGGPMMALAVRGGAASVPIGTSTSALTTGAKSPEGPTASAAASTPFGTATGIPGIAGVGGPAPTGAAVDPTAATTGAADPTSIQSSLQQSADMNMYMLQVQQQVQQQGQQFTTLSNVMKAQYDTVKNAIGNIR